MCKIKIIQIENACISIYMYWESKYAIINWKTVGTDDKYVNQRTLNM